ncbi:MAG: HAD hydrolase-like protein [Treponema sp.]|nr:HAD hydrolase-like protein [Treponema sp.]
MKQNYIFFDLDGTLTESGPGIVNSVRYALKRWGIEEPSDAALLRFIGPPLVYSFSTFYGFSQEDAVKAMSVYREYYAVHGIFENGVYEGIPELLGALKDAGKHLCVATGKPEKFMFPILKRYDLLQYFDFCGGSDEAETHADKTTVIRYVMDGCGARADDVVMVGDRHHDIDGAKANGVTSAGILYGYGDRAELEAAGADYIAETVDDLKRLLLG